MFLFRCCFWTTRERTPVTHPLTSHSDSWVEVWDRPWKSCQPKSWESQCSRENTTQWVIHGKTNGEKITKYVGSLCAVGRKQLGKSTIIEKEKYLIWIFLEQFKTILSVEVWSLSLWIIWKVSTLLDQADTVVVTLQWYSCQLLPWRNTAAKWPWD